MTSLEGVAGYLQGVADMLEASPRQEVGGTLCLVMSQSFAKEFLEKLRAGAGIIEEAVKPKEPEHRTFVPYRGEPIYVSG